MASKKNLHPDLSGIETAQLEERLRTGQLTTSDVEHLLKILALFSTLRQLLHKRSLGLLTLLRRMFGVKSEPHKASDDERPRDKSGDTSGGHGRRGRDGYPGAERIAIEYPDLKPKQKCPECNKGRLWCLTGGLQIRGNMSVLTQRMSLGIEQDVMQSALVSFLPKKWRLRRRFAVNARCGCFRHQFQKSAVRSPK